MSAPGAMSVAVAGVEAEEAVAGVEATISNEGRPFERKSEKA